jgi:antitoxin HicB
METIEMAWIYGVKIAKDGGGFAVTVRDLPEVLTFGATMDEARALGADAIGAVVAHRIEKGKELAVPSAPEHGEVEIGLSLQTAAKASTYLAWRKSGPT